MIYSKIFFRTLLFYLIINIIYRIMGKREVGKLSMVDFIVSILVAEFAALSIENYEQSIFISILPLSLLVGIQILIAKISLKNKTVRNLFDGTPSIMIKHGKINFKEMVKQRYNLDDLLTQLREKDIRAIEDIDYAILENSGRLSVFRKGKSNTYPLPIILDGMVEEGTLKELDKDKTWLERQLQKEKISLEDVFYGFYKEDKIYVIKKKDILHN